MAEEKDDFFEQVDFRGWVSHKSGESFNKFYAILKGSLLYFFDSEITSGGHEVANKAKFIFNVEGGKISDVSDKHDVPFAYLLQLLSSEEVVGVEEKEAFEKLGECLNKARVSGVDVSSLDESQKKALEELKGKISGATEPTLLRFLDASGYNVSDAEKKYNSMIEWRENIGADRLGMKDVHKEAMTGKVMMPGTRDRQGRPIIVINPRYHEAEESTPLSLSQVTVYYLDRACEQIQDNEQIAVFIDMDGLKPNKFDSRVPNIILDIVQNKYPRRVGAWCFLNQPSFFNVVWNTVKVWMEPYFRQRVHLLGNDKKRLELFIDSANLPVSLGGNVEFDYRDYIRGRYKVEGWDFDSNNDDDELAKGLDSVLRRALEEEPSAEEATEGAKKTGWMHKEGGIVKNYKKRYFVLKNNLLYYFKTDKSEKPQGVVPLRKVKVKTSTKTKNPTFELETSTRTYFIYTETEPERDAWMEAIQSQVI